MKRIDVVSLGVERPQQQLPCKCQFSKTRAVEEQKELQAGGGNAGAAEGPMGVGLSGGQRRRRRAPDKSKNFGSGRYIADGASPSVSLRSRGRHRSDLRKDILESIVNVKLRFQMTQVTGVGSTTL